MTAIRRTTAVLTTLLVMAPTLVGCGGAEEPEPDGGSPATGACGWLTGQRPGQETERVAILVDASTSTRATSGVGSVDYPAALSDELNRVVEAQQPVAVSAFSSAAGDIDLLTRIPNWKEQANNPGNQRAKKREAESCLAADVKNAQRATPAGSGTDILRAMTQAAAWLREAPEGVIRRLVVATDGLSTSGCAGLRDSGFRGQQEIDAIVKQCGKGEFVPGTLAGISVTMIGIGFPAAGQPLPDTEVAKWLRSLWQKLCRQAGGEFIPVERTVARTADAEPAAEVSADKQDPTVDFSVQGVYSVPGALFDTGKATLRPEAMPLLMEIAVELRSKSYKRIDVLGYADPRVGGGVDNKQLSEDRARAVAETLKLDGVRVDFKGMGATSTCFDGTAVPANADDDAALQCLRRVDIKAS